MDDLLHDTFETWRRGLPEGASATLKEAREGGQGVFARIDAEAGGRLVQVNVWDTGEVDMFTADSASDQGVTATHRKIQSEADVLQLLATIGAYMEAGA